MSHDVAIVAQGVIKCSYSLSEPKVPVLGSKGMANHVVFLQSPPMGMNQSDF